MRNPKIILSVLVILACKALSAQHPNTTNSPYAFIGDQSQTLAAINDDVKSPEHFCVRSILASGKVVTAFFDYENHILSLEDEKGDIIATDTIPAESQAFTTIDPMAEEYCYMSPYAYCADNPLAYSDPTGMVIEKGSIVEWGNLRSGIESKINMLQSHVNRLLAKAKSEGWSAEKLSAKIGDRAERINSLNASLGTMGVLENSSQVYSLLHAVGTGGLSFDANSNAITINFCGTANFVHEITHAGQFEGGDIAFINNGTVLQDIYDEVKAYRAQYAYDPKSVSLLTSTSSANSFGTITPTWVQGLRNLAGNAIYAPGGSANIGLVPVNINATKGILLQAYPWNAAVLQGLPEGFNVRLINGLYYKR